MTHSTSSRSNSSKSGFTRFRAPKAAAVVLSFVLGASLLAGCSDSAEPKAGSQESAANVNKEGFPIVKEKVTLRMMGPDVGVQKWADMPAFQEMEKKSGISFQFDNPPLDSFETKKNLTFASGEYPDIFYAASLTQADEVNYGSQGILLPLEDLIDNYAPNLKKILDDNPEIRKSITTPDGHIYSLPVINQQSIWYRSPMWYNGEFLDALKVSEDKLPKTTEELYDLLVRLRDEDPNGNGKKDEIPLVSVKLDDIRSWLLGAWGIYGEDIYNDANGKVHFARTEDGYREFLTYMNRLWKENLLDHETFSQTPEQKKAKGANNQVGLFQDWHAYFTHGGEPTTNDPMFVPVKSDSVDQPAVAIHPGLSTGSFAITESNPAPEASIRWVDYMYGYEGAMLFDKGPEGLMYETVNAEDHTKKWLPLPDKFNSREDYRGTLTPNYGTPAPTLLSTDLQKGLKEEFDVWVDKQNEEKILAYDPQPPFPILYLTPEEQAEISSLRSDMDTYVQQMEAKFVTGQEPLSGWDNYLATVKQMGSDRMIEIYQTAYDRWKSS
ncbi:extracellular solute-binding protein [Paenibacillus sp. Z6-24]